MPPRKKAKNVATVLDLEPGEEPIRLPAVELPSPGEEPAELGVSAPVPPTDDPFFALPHGNIVPDADNARKVFDAAKLADLAATIATHGLLQPILVTPGESALVWRLVAGERRWRAIALLIAEGRWEPGRLVPCRLADGDALARAEAALIENLQRVDLNHMEAGEAFEVLGVRHHKSNRQIAAAIGRSPEYVQQHRRLTELDPDDRESVRSGETPMHEALRLVAKPGPKTLGAEVMLVLAEIYHRSKTKPLGASWEQATECHPDAQKDAALKQLVERRLISFSERDHDTQRAKIRVEYATFEIARAYFKGCDVKNEAGGLVKLRAAAGVPGYNPLAKDYDPEIAKAKFAYATAWLNGPFEISDAGAKVLAERKAAKAKEKADEAAREEARKAKEAAGKALAAEFAGLDHTRRIARLPHIFAQAGLAGPFAVDQVGYYPKVVDGTGKAVITVSWDCAGGDSRTIAILIAACLTEVAEKLKTVAAPAAGEDDAVDPRLARLAGVTDVAALEPAE